MSCKGVGAYQFDKGRYGATTSRLPHGVFALHRQGRAALHRRTRCDEARPMEKFARVRWQPSARSPACTNQVELSGKDGAYTIKSTAEDHELHQRADDGRRQEDADRAQQHLRRAQPVMYQAQCISCTYATAT